MRVVLSAIIFICSVVILTESVFACTCLFTPLSKRFRKSQAIFVGRLGDYENVPNSEIQNIAEGRPIFEVTKPLKGISKKLVAINLDWNEIAKGGMCPTLFRFDERDEYLIFAYGKDLTIQSVCSDSRKLESQSTDWEKHTAKEIQKLESFWFRTRARLWPF